MVQLEKAGHFEAAVQKKWVSHITGDTQLQKAAENKPEILLDLQHLTQVFPLTRKLAVKAVDDVSFQIRRGEIFGLVGESGCGKSTFGKTVMMLEKPTGGEVLFNYNGEYKDITKFNKDEMFEFRKKVQMVFQDPYSALNPQKKKQIENTWILWVWTRCLYLM